MIGALKMDRKSELLGCFSGLEQETQKIIVNLVDDVVFLEGLLSNLRKLPFIKVHPDNPELQKPTPAAKQYKELLQQYNNCIKILTSVLRKDATEEESNIMKFMASLRNGEI